MQNAKYKPIDISVSYGESVFCWKSSTSSENRLGSEVLALLQRTAVLPRQILIFQNPKSGKERSKIAEGSPPDITSGRLSLINLQRDREDSIPPYYLLRVTENAPARTFSSENNARIPFISPPADVLERTSLFYSTASPTKAARMKESFFTSEVIIHRPLVEIFPFFGNAKNLELITPPWLQFRILTPDPIVMRERVVIRATSCG